jgi:hypothetical protein
MSHEAYKGRRKGQDLFHGLILGWMTKMNYMSINTQIVNEYMSSSCDYHLIQFSLVTYFTHITIVSL